MTPNRAQRRAEKKKEWRIANQLYHREEVKPGKFRLFLTTRKGRIGERKISRWYRRRKKVSP